MADARIRDRKTKGSLFLGVFMTMVTNRPGPAPSEIARIARRMGGTRNEVNETESTLISNVPAATGQLGETVKADPGTGISDPNLVHAQLLAGSTPSRSLVNATDPNLPTPGKPAVAHKKVATAATAVTSHTPPAHGATETTPLFSQAHDNTPHPAHSAPGASLLK
jgi:hypothetical protein